MGDVAERWDSLASAHRSDVPCQGGPLAGLTLAVWSWGDHPQVPERIPVGMGCYSLVDRHYEWSPKP